MVDKNTMGTKRLEPFSTEYMVDTNTLSDGKSPFHLETDKAIVPWVIELNFLQTDHILRFKLHDTLTLGRSTGENAPHVDLTPYHGREYGVSRRHAIIVARKKYLTIRDLKSTNGTYINGLRLISDQEIPLEHGDHLSFGNLVARVNYAVVPPNKLATADALDPVMPTAAEPSQGYGLHVLVVEDDEEVAHVYEMMLHEAGYRVTLVHDAVEGMAVFVEDTPDAVIMDLVMTDSYQRAADVGLAMLHQVKNRAALTGVKIPVVVVSGATGQHITRQVHEAGAALFLPKPVRIDELIHAVGLVIESGQAEV